MLFKNIETAQFSFHLNSKHVILLEHTQCVGLRFITILINMC